MNTEGTGSHTYKECHKTKSPWNHTSTAHKEKEQLGDRGSDGQSSCNSGDGTGQMAQPWMFMMMIPIPPHKQVAFHPTEGFIRFLPLLLFTFASRQWKRHLVTSFAAAISCLVSWNDVTLSTYCPSTCLANQFRLTRYYFLQPVTFDYQVPNWSPLLTIPLTFPGCNSSNFESYMPLGKRIAWPYICYMHCVGRISTTPLHVPVWAPTRSLLSLGPDI